MVSQVLRRKLVRDIRRQWAQFAAVVIVIALGVAVFVAASDAYRNLGESFNRAYATQRLPDVVLVGANAAQTAGEAARLPGRPLVTPRSQVETGTRVAGHAVMGRVISVPDQAQPAVSRLAVRSGRLPAAGQVFVEQHLADHFHLRPGSVIELYGTSGWTRATVSGTGLSSEYLWPARSRQETMTSPEQFGVLFARQPLVASLSDTPEAQLALFAQDRAQAPALVAAATALARSHDLVTVTRSEQPSYNALRQDVQSFGQFAELLPLLFLAAAVLGAFILLSRLVTAQRAVIGTLTANGLSRSVIRRHYLGYGLAAGVGGAVPGLVGGWFLGAWMTTLYTGALGLPLGVASIHPAVLAGAAAAGIAAAALAAWGPARAAARTPPAEAMRTAPAGRGGRSLLERILPPLRRLPARWRMVPRGLSRNPRRAGFSIAGVAISLTMVLVFAGLRDTINSVLDRQFGTVDRSDGQLYSLPGAANTLTMQARAVPGVATAEPFSRDAVTLASGARRYETILIGLPATTTLHRFIDSAGHPVKLPPAGGLLLSEGLRQNLHLRAGDPVSITITADGTRLSEPVAGFVDEPLTAVSYVSLGHLDARIGHPNAVGALIGLRPGVDRHAAGQRLGALPGAAAYMDSAALETTMRNAFSIMDLLVGIMLAFALVMAAALLFNAMSANIAERTVELGTLRAAGLSSGLLARLAAAENLLLTGIGIPLGLVAGTMLARWFMATYTTEGYQWTLRMRPSTLLLVTVGVLGASIVSQFPVLRTVRHVDITRIVRERSL